MGELFGRSYKLKVSLRGVEGFKIDSSIKPSLDIAFTVVRTLSREPNTANIEVYNLKELNRSKLETLGDAVIELEAGYQDDNGLIFKGDVELNNAHIFPDWITKFEADDGGNSVRLDRVNLSFAPGTTLATVIKKVADSMRVGIGNTVATALTGSLIDGGREYLNGIVTSGNASRQLNRLVKSSGLEFSIQNDQLQLLPKDTPLPTTAVLLKDNTGLVGRPSIGNKGEVTYRSLLNKDIVPGGLVTIDSQAFKGQVRNHKCTYIGSSFGQDWYVDGEAKQL